MKVYPSQISQMTTSVVLDLSILPISQYVAVTGAHLQFPNDNYFELIPWTTGQKAANELLMRRAVAAALMTGTGDGAIQLSIAEQIDMIFSYQRTDATHEILRKIEIGPLLYYKMNVVQDNNGNFSHWAVLCHPWADDVGSYIACTYFTKQFGFSPQLIPI